MSTLLWDRYKNHLCVCRDIELALDISRMKFSDEFFDTMKDKISKALADMKSLESGIIANPDEKRMVGHYWLRSPNLAPTPELQTAIVETLNSIKAFASDVHQGKILAPNGQKFTDLLVIGIGGSALGPQWIASALSSPADKMRVHFLDNTDPEGISGTLEKLAENHTLETTLVVVISKSGSTPETRNGMISTALFLQSHGLKLAEHAVAITGSGSKLDKTAHDEGWIKTFPMWDWVGGRTSELSAVGLLPAALQGIDIDAMLEGAAACDVHTRSEKINENPAALMALMWFAATDGKGKKDLVILPYKDKLLLFSRYLQQLIMESLGKALDLDGNTVHQGLTVYGNKGSTDQHAYVQQLRDGIDNFFITFVDVLEYGAKAIEVDKNITPGDYLHGFLQGTRRALTESGRQSMTITVSRVDAKTIGALIALFERTVGLYASMIHINAYHQPGVEAGKKAASNVLALQNQCIELLADHKPRTIDEIAAELKLEDEIEMIASMMTYLQANHRILSDKADYYDFSRHFHV